MERIDSIGQLLADHVSVAGRVVVDVGCGTGDLARFLVGRGASVIGVDAEGMLARAEAAPPVGGERYLRGGGEALPLPDASADVVVFSASLHHVPADRLEDAIRECARVLRPGGRAAFVEPVAEPGSYYEITRLTGDEAEVQRLAHAAILAAPAVGLEPVASLRCYLERSFTDYERLVAVFVDSDELRSECLAAARPITARLAAAAGVSFDEFRYRSICRLDVLRRTPA